MDITKMNPAGFQTIMGLVCMAFERNLLMVEQVNHPNGQDVSTTLKANIWGVRVTIFTLETPKNNCPPLFSS